MKAKRLSPGRYQVVIDGFIVYVTRSACGRHPLKQTYSHRPNWTATNAGGRVLSDGNGTMSGAIENAKVAIVRERARLERA